MRDHPVSGGTRLLPFIRYSSRLLSRHQTWLRELTAPVPEPTWATPNEICLEVPLARLRRFGGERKGIPWLLVSPNAGHHSAIADYAPGQSLAGALLEGSPGAPVLAVEWLSATPETKGAGIDDYLLALGEMIERARTLAGANQARLVGLCQGGWLSAMYAALHPEEVANLILAGAPIDFKAGRGKLTRAVEYFGLEWYEAAVKRSGGVMPGSYMVAGWKLMNPIERFIEDPWKLWQNIDDEKFVGRHRKFRNWYEWTLDLPGAFYLQVVRQLFHENRLVEGRFSALGKPVKLAEIRCPVSTIAGSRDDITLPAQLEAVGAHVSSDRVRHRTVDAGHIGLFMAGNVIREVWPGLIREAMADAKAA